MIKKMVYGLVIDRSASMSDLREEMLMSINNRIKSIKKNSKEKEQEAFVELVTFNHSVKRVYSMEPVESVEQLKRNDYEIDGSTSLYDALGSTLERMQLIYGEEVRKGNCNVAIVVYTDGHENTSRMYSQSQIKEMLVNLINFH